MKALVTGAAGFVGGYLINCLREDMQYQVAAAKRETETLPVPADQILSFDLLDGQSTRELLEAAQPDCIFHLAAQSSVALSWKDPWQTVDVNIKGTLNLLEAARALDKQPRILLIGSSEEYGHVREDELPVREENPVRPGNLYAATKVCQTQIGKIYADAYGMPIVMVRAFNHIGPGQSSQFVVADFCRQVAEFEKGLRPPVLRVGNLQARRDFTDVRDVVRAYALLMEKGSAGELYNVGSGRAIAIESILAILLQYAACEIVVERDPGKIRPLDMPVVQADIGKLARDTGWQPLQKIEDTIGETLEWWRRQIQ